MRAATELLASWAAHDEAHALHAADRAVIGATEAMRSLVLDLLATANARDLFTACARLGALLAEGGASPSLAASTLEGAVRAAGSAFPAARTAPARAALLEGYVAAVRDAERLAARAAWEYPACVVPLGRQRAAVACAFPEADAEARSAWAARIAKGLTRAKVKAVVLAGEGAARDEVESALSLVGIAVMPEVPAGLRWPWQRP